jgi:hypothetical protein
MFGTFGHHWVPPVTVEVVHDIWPSDQRWTVPPAPRSRTGQPRHRSGMPTTLGDKVHSVWRQGLHTDQPNPTALDGGIRCGRGWPTNRSLNARSRSMQTKFYGSTVCKHAPSRRRLHRAAAVLDDQALHDLTPNDVFWDKIVEVTSIGERDVYRVSVADTHNVVAQGVSVRASLVKRPSL